MAMTLAQFLENAGSVNHARDFRRMHEKLLGYDLVASPGTGAGGVCRHLGAATTGDMAVTQRGAGANMSVDISVGGGMVDGSEATTQGAYFAYNDAVTNVAISAADPTNPRIDIIGIRVRDTEYSVASNHAALVVVTGTPAGVPAEPTLPSNFLTLARVDVAALAASITNANITDRRKLLTALGGVAPVSSFANLPGVNNWNGQFGFDYTNNLMYVRSQGVWVCITPIAAPNINTSESSASTSYTALATPGPLASIQSGTKLLVLLHTLLQCGATLGQFVYMAFALSGATTRASADADALVVRNQVAATVAAPQMGGVFPITGVTAGLNTATAQYKVDGGAAATWASRRLVVVGIP